MSNQGTEFHARKHGTGASPQHPEAIWTSPTHDLKHQPGRAHVPENTVELLPKGTHLPPDRTFLPQTDGRRMGTASTGEDAGEDSYVIGMGLTHEQIQETLGGTTSADVYAGMGRPGDQSGVEAAALGDGGGRKTGGGVAKYGHGEMLAQDRQKGYDPSREYVGNSREEKEYRNTSSEDKGARTGNRGASNRTG